MSKFNVAFIAASAIIFSQSSVLSAQTACTATTTAAIAAKIANGHAWTDHKSDFVVGTIKGGLAMPASPKVTTIAEFNTHIQSIMGSGTNRVLLRSRKAYWGASTGTIVMFDPNNVDCGTSFRPDLGKTYYTTTIS
jgi:hypothetical protein